MKIKNIVMTGLIVVLSMAVMNCANQNKKHGFKRIHFDFDRSYIRSDMVNTMDHNVKLMKKRKKHFSTASSYGSGKGGWALSVEGHCDERGSNEYNYALGARRAESAKSYMVTHGVNPDRLKTVSYGEDRPLKQGHNESAWWYNRRAEFVVNK